MGRDLKWYEEVQPKEYFLLVCTSVVEAAISGTSLTVQWLRLHAFNAGHLGSIPGWGTKIPYAIWCSQKKKKKKAAISDQISDFQHLEDILTPTAVQTGYKLLQEYVHSCLP